MHNTLVCARALCCYIDAFCVALQRHRRCHLIWEVHLCVILQWLMSPLFSTYHINSRCLASLLQLFSLLLLVRFASFVAADFPVPALSNHTISFCQFEFMIGDRHTEKIRLCRLLCLLAFLCTIYVVFEMVHLFRYNTIIFQRQSVAIRSNPKIINSHTTFELYVHPISTSTHTLTRPTSKSKNWR